MSASPFSPMPPARLQSVAPGSGSPSDSVDGTVGKRKKETTKQSAGWLTVHQASQSFCILNNILRDEPGHVWRLLPG